MSNDMRLRDLTERMENGAAHLFLFAERTGEVILSTIWYNTLDEGLLERRVASICVRDYELRVGLR